MPARTLLETRAGRGVRANAPSLGHRVLGSPGYTADVVRARATWAAGGGGPVLFVGLATLVACTAAPATPATPDPPTEFGRGFVDLSTAIEATPPFFLGGGGLTFFEPEPSIGAFADVDGDGATDVILSFLVNEAGRSSAAYRYDATMGRLVPMTGITLPVEQPLWAVLDLDGDGFVDLISPKNGVDVYWGLGGGAFSSSSILVASAPPAVAPGAAGFALADIDADGWLDMLSSSKLCCADCKSAHPLLRVGAREFVDRADLVDAASPINPYAMIAVALGPDEMVLGTIGHICEPEVGPVFFRQRDRDVDGYPRFEPTEVVSPDSVELGPWPVTDPVSLARQAPMGAAIGDLDDDGVDDLAVTLDPDQLLYRGAGRWPLTEMTPDAYRLAHSESGADMLGWGVALIDLDRDLRKDVVVVHGNDYGAFFEPDSFIGPQWTTAYWNAGRFQFSDVSAALALDRPGQWRTLSVGDLDADGDADLIVGGLGELPRVYRNDVDTGNHGLAVRLKGTTSNHLGLGAHVAAVVVAGQPAQHYLVGGVFSPYSHSEPLAFVAAGPATSIARLTITWPSGLIQELVDVAAAGVLVVEEPSLLVVEPVGRHLPANGKARATIRVTPRGLDGAPRVAATVEATLAGAGQLAGAPVRDGDAWVITVVAPATAGSAALAITIDGVVVGVRPRLFWDRPL